LKTDGLLQASAAAAAAAAQAHRQVGVTRFDEGDLAGAQDSFAAAVLLDPTNVGGQNGLGLLLWQIHCPPGA